MKLLDSCGSGGEDGGWRGGGGVRGGADVKFWTLVRGGVFQFMEIRSYFVCIFIVDWNFLTKFFSSDPRFNGNILTYLYLKSGTSAHAQLCNYSFIHTIHKFHDMVSVGNLHWGYFLINGAIYNVIIY